MAANKAREIAEELHSVVIGSGGLIDAFLPPLVFLGVHAVAGAASAIAGSAIVSLALGFVRIARRQSVGYAVAGMAGSLVAFAATRWLNRSEAFFLPEIANHALLALLSLASLLIGRPLVAWTSHLVRRWPLAWYWHPRVLPAYTEVTLAWAALFAAQAGVQALLLSNRTLQWLAIASLLNGWPATIVLLILSYLYGTWRLSHLAGPSVEEFVAGAAPPWRGQRRGF